jgi:hypothetical protein
MLIFFTLYTGPRLIAVRRGLVEILTGSPGEDVAAAMHNVIATRNLRNDDSGLVYSAKTVCNPMIYNQEKIAIPIIT